VNGGFATALGHNLRCRPLVACGATPAATHGARSVTV